MIKFRDFLELDNDSKDDYIKLLKNKKGKENVVIYEYYENWYRGSNRLDDYKNLNNLIKREFREEYESNGFCIFLGSIVCIPFGLLLAIFIGHVFTTQWWIGMTIFWLVELAVIKSVWTPFGKLKEALRGGGIDG